MKNITVLLSASSSPSMPGLINCLRNNGERKIKIVGVDMASDPSTQYIVDAFYKVPAATHPNYVDIILDICKKEKVDIYFPNISAEVSAVIERKREFDESNILLSVSNKKSIDISNNKLATYDFLKENGISVPKYYPIHSIGDFKVGCKLLGYPEKPVCLKIIDGSGSRGVRIIDSTKSRYQIFVNEKPNSFITSYNEMINTLKEADIWHEMLLVQYMPGNEYTVDLLADNGEVLFEVGRENVVSVMSIAQESILKYDQKAYEICEKIVNLLKMDGNIGFDFMRDFDGTPRLMDINPRITATVSVIAAGGVNLPYLRIKQLLGEALPELKPEYGTHLRRRYYEIYTDKEGKRVYIGDKNEVL